MYMGREVFDAYDPARGKALADYYRYARDNDLYLTYVIINPQADRSKSAAAQQDPFLSAGVVDRDAEGITVRGAKMLATAASWPMRCSSPASSRCSRATRITPSLRHSHEHQGLEDPVPQVLRGLGPVGVRQSARQPLRRE